MPKPSAADGASDAAEAEAKAAFHLRLRARGIRDLDVLRAFEIVPRARFLPARYAALAGRDLPLPLPCGQTTHEPTRYALVVDALGIEPTHRVLEIGSGSGYLTAVLAHLAGEVLGLERWADLARSAQARLAALDLARAEIVWGDGLAVPAGIGRFDRILVDATLPDLASLDELLLPGGRVVAGRGGDMVLFESGAALRNLGPCIRAPLVGGLAGAASRSGEL